VERTQELLADLCMLFDKGALPKVPVFLDSPLAIKATEVFSKYLGELEDVGGRRDLFRHPNIHFTETVEASKAINRYRRGAIVLAASGMCDAGRIRHHLKQHLWRQNATVLMVGYQAPGTLGSLLQSGAPAVRIQGEDIRVRAAIRKLDVYSGHADGDELIAWLKDRIPIKRAAFLTHGEDKALDAMKDGMIAAGMPEDRLFIPQLDDEIVLGDGQTGPRLGAPPRRLPPEAVGRLDWHNDLAQFSLDLREVLDQAADDRRRNVILRRIRRALEED
jgi:metallo-beta-lactamase family protein